MLKVYITKDIDKIKDRDITFKETILPLWLPVLAVVGLVLPANFSTAALIFLMVLIITFIGGYPIKYLLSIIGAGIVILGVFILTAKAFPRAFPHLVDTWINQGYRFRSEEETNEIQ